MTKKTNVLVRMWKKGEPCTLLVGMQISTAIVENSMEAVKNLKLALP